MNARAYRLAPPDRTGWFLGLGAAQVLPLFGGLSAATIVLAATQSIILAAIPAAVGLALAFIRLSGKPLLEATPVATIWVLSRNRRRFEAPLPISEPTPVLPSAFGNCEVLEFPSADGEFAVAADKQRGLASASLRVSAVSPFLLAEIAEQERLLAAFGDVLAPLCREAGPVVSLRWSSFAAPVGRAPGPELIGPAAASYRELLGAVGAAAQHEVLLTLTVTGRRGRPDTTLIETLIDELRLLAERLADTGLSAVPVGPETLASVLRRRLDPAGRGSPEVLVSLAQAVGPAALAGSGPLCVQERWDHLRVDATIHRAYHLWEWPRTGVPAAWMSDLLLSLPVVRTLCVVLEPVSPRASRRAVGRQAAKLESDEEQRRRAGFRIGAEHDATRGALATREEELIAGHPEFDYAGLLVLSAGTLEELEANEAQARSVTAAAGVELAPLHGRHAAALGVCLPLTRTLASRLR